MQYDVDLVYDDWCGIIREQMYNELPYKSINVGLNNKRRRVAKQWWNGKLTELWDVVCETERKWLNCTTRSDKAKFKSEYVSSRKAFDREVQRLKRFNWYTFQRELLDDCGHDNNSFWKIIGKTGVGQTQKRCIPMEVVLEDRSVSRETADVLHKWKQDFSSLLNCQNS